MQHRHRSRIVAGTNDCEQPGVTDPLVLAKIDQLRRAQVGMEQVGTLLGHVHAQDRAPRAAPQDDLALAEALGEIGGQGDAVVAHLLDGQRRIFCRRAAAVGHPCPALVPLHQGELPGPCPIHRIGIRTQRIAGAAADEQDDRVRATVALDGDPLLDAADGHEALLVHRCIRGRATWRRHRCSGQVRGRGGGAGRKGKREQAGDESAGGVRHDVIPIRSPATRRSCILRASATQVEPGVLRPVAATDTIRSMPRSGPCM